MTRAAWQEFICSPIHAGRHLSGIGRNAVPGTSEPIDLAALQSFLERLRGANDDIWLLGNVVDLITGDYLAFSQGPLHRILDSLSNERLSREEIIGPGLRGNPRWDLTTVRRLSGALSPVQYVTRLAHRTFDLPENRLLSWLVHGIRGRVAAIEQRVGTAALHHTLRSLDEACQQALVHDWFADVTVPLHLSDDLVLAAKRHRRVEYRLAAQLAQRCREIETSDRDAWWYTILSLLAVHWLEPLSDDDLFELYVLVLTLDVLAEEVGLGEPIEYGLVTPGRGAVAVFQGESKRLRIFFDQSPASVLGMRTAYSQVLQAYTGISGAERRPDVLVVIDGKDEDDKRLVIVEAKKTSDGRYLSDSVYKLFGYLYDFQYYSDFRTTGVLVVPTGITRLFGPEDTEPPIYIASGDDRAGFSEALVAAAGVG